MLPWRRVEVDRRQEQCHGFRLVAWIAFMGFDRDEERRIAWNREDGALGEPRERVDYVPQDESHVAILAGPEARRRSRLAERQVARAARPVLAA